MNVDYKLIGKKIQSERKARGMTQEFLAEKLDVSIGYISQVERGITKISLDLLAAICGVLDCDISKLVSDSAAGSRYLSSETAAKFASLNPKERRIVNAFMDLLIENR